MARMKDFKDKFNIIKDKFKTDKSDDLSLKLPYDSNSVLTNVLITKDLCTEMKKIGSFGIATYSINDDDKKTKKTLNTMSQLFSETSSKFQECNPMKGPLSHNASVLMKISNFTKEFEKTLQHQVIGPLAEIESTCNEIQELRKKLGDQRRELGNLSDKLVRMVDQTNADEQKCHTLKDQIDELEMEFDNTSDVYIQKIMLFEASSFEHAQSINEMIILRTEYHDKCYKELKNVVPETNQFMEERRTPYAFRYPLENHLREIKKCIAYPIEKCVTALSNVDDLRQEGLFRVSGGKSKSNLLCSALNIMKFDQISCKWSPHVIADALKRYLREMPVPLFGKISSAEWDKCYEKYKSGNRQEAYWLIKELLNKMPKSYYNNLEYLIRFLTKVIQEKNYNLMNVQNICTVFTPNLFKQATDGMGNVGMNMDASCTFVLESLLTETNFFFQHSNRRVASSILSLELKLRSELESRLGDQDDQDKSQILYRTSSESSCKPVFSERSSVEIRSQRRRQRCLDSMILFDNESSASQISSNHNSLNSGSGESTLMEYSISLVPP